MTSLLRLALAPIVAVFVTSTAVGFQSPLSFLTNGPSPQAGQEFGSSVLIADLDGDGLGELIVGAKDRVPAGSTLVRPGEVLILRGPVYGITQWSFLPSPTPKGRSEYGWVMTSGDFNGDGHTDLAVGSPGTDVDGYFPPLSQGEVWVFFGPWSLPSNGLAVYAGSMVIQEDVSRRQNTPANTPKPYYADRFGSTLAVGRLNDTGAPTPTDDLVIGSATSLTIDPVTGTSYDEAGQAYVYWGSTVTPLTQWVEVQHPTQPYVSDTRWGWNLAAGNVQDSAINGADDLFIGSYKRDMPPAISNAGDVIVFLDHGTGVGSFVGLTTYQLTRQGGSSVDMGFGISIDLGFLDSDSFADVAIGAWGENAAFGQYPGEAHVFVGGATFPTSASNFNLLAPIPSVTTMSDRFGESLRWVDSDGDGLAELLVGSPTHDLGTPASPKRGEGRAFLRKFVSPTSWTTINDPTPEHHLKGGFGHAVTRGILSPDMKVDIAIANRTATAPGSLGDGGEVYVVVWQ